VKIDWNDSSGKTVDSSIVGTHDLAAGAVATPVAFSREPATTTLVPQVAKAQHY